MPIVRLDKVSLSYGLRPLLDGVDLQIRRQERLCLLGRNGEGKSSLLKMIAGEVKPDSGEVWVRPGVRVATLAQEAEDLGDRTVADVIGGGLDGNAEGLEPWEARQRIDRVAHDLGLDLSLRMQTLSGGWRRRAMLGRALVRAPDLLLLDEPTNHLDIEAITWLEDFVKDFPNALLFISHDRAFVRRVANRIVELDRGVLTSWDCAYDAYVTAKRESLEVEARHSALFDKKLRQEEAWIRQGVEARRTRNEGRVRALKQLRRERAARRERSGQIDVRLQDADKSGKLVFEAENVSMELGGRTIIRDFSVRIMRGDRIGIIGPNGCGKSTLIKLLIGELAPTSGRLQIGTGLRQAYFDQQREQLNPELSIADNVTGGSGDSVTVNGVSRHVSSYLRDFLFSSERMKAPVTMLSGGERNRLLLARLFAKPMNLMVLDEPTNDLDVETLDMLEELIAEFSGTLLLVSHDRAFLDNVVTGTLVFEGGALINEYVGGYADWLTQRRPPALKAAPAAKPAPLRGAADERPGPDEKARQKPLRKLSFREQRELQSMPDHIHRLEEDIAALQTRVNDAAFYRRAAQEIATELNRLETLIADLESAYLRWQELEAIAS